MSLHHTPEEHASDPPATWQVVKAAERCWQVRSSLGGVLDTFTTQREALAAREPGSRLVREYESDGRWFAGETPHGWKSYAQVVAERLRIHDRWHASKPSEHCQFCASAPSITAVAAGR